MSYCRWSSLNFGCDLYVYEDSAGGWTIHVAGNRVVGKVPEVVWPVDQSVEARDRFVTSYQSMLAFLETAEREPVGLPLAGESFYGLPTAGACADKVEELIALGYRVPDYVVPDLRVEEEFADE
jgi:hypothetical protein